ncbi:hypothetical protein [Algibacter sp. PT7-4]|uniref:hypothetical protein n=1 Tax=Algibacter ulvanivorans TaxID=3400999 RepID=UPI003AABF7D2
MLEKKGFGFIEPESCIDDDLTVQEIDENDEVSEVKEISLYDFNKTKEENLQTGVKYLLIPISSDGFGKVENEQLLSEFTKIVSNEEEWLDYNNESDLLVVDYATMFGLRLNRFKNYNSDFFSCDERVLFEFLVMKFKYFGFKPFYLSFATITKEMGIKIDRATSIIKKFKGLGFLESEVVKSLIEGKQRQVTYYCLHTNIIINLLPKIYLDEETEWDIKHDIEKYLKPKVKRSKTLNDSKKSQMQ